MGWQKKNVRIRSWSRCQMFRQVYSLTTKWSYFIAKYASDRYKIQLSCSDITVQHSLVEYFAHRGGKGNSGKLLSAETIAKLSMAMTGKKHTNESRVKMSKAQTGKKHTNKSRPKMSEAQTGKKRTLETGSKNSTARMGKKHTNEARAKISEAQTGKKHTDKARAKMRRTRQ